MITNVQEIDLDSFFGPDVHIPAGDPSYSTDMDIDQAINNALAEIDETTKTTQIGFTRHASTPYQKQSVKIEYQSPSPYMNTPLSTFNDQAPQQSRATQQHLHQHQEQITTTQPHQMKPLSPASLLSDDSRSPQTPTISEYELLKLRELYEQKCKDLDIAIMELKKSEKKRFTLMKENKQLKEAVVKLSMEF